MPPLGAHMSIAGGMEQAFARCSAVGGAALRIFTKNAGQWRGKPIRAEAAEAFRRVWQARPLGPVIAPASYRINLALLRQLAGEA